MIENSKIALLVVAMMATGVLVLPQAVSLFAGQHYWYSINDSGNQIPCQKCHADVFEELDQSSFHINFSGGTEGQADQTDCEACHRSNANIKYAEGDGDFQAGDEAHAASVIACMLCHQWNADQAVSDGYEGWPAGGFNISGFGVSEDYNYSKAASNGTFAAHNAFVAKAINDDTLQDSNEACVACHTHTAVKINFSHKRSLEFDVGFADTGNLTTESGVHNWTVTNWAVNGTAYAIIYGDTTGENASTSYNASIWPGNVSGVDYTYND
ncbi:MAG: hypothetical protein ACLFVI_00255 [Archaeoglobaceae archaeon]